MKLDFSHVDIGSGIGQIKDAINILISTPVFIKKHQLWSGFLDHKWVFVFSIFIAGLFTFTLYKDIYNYFSPSIENTVAIDIPTEGLANGIKELEEAAASVPDEAKGTIEDAQHSLADVKDELDKDHKPLFSGSLKFLLLIFLEVVIYHFAVKTNNILKQDNKILVFKDFLKAQIRMIKVMGRKWIYGLIMYVLISILCGVSGINFMKDTIMFLIYGFYLGFAFIDNYLEQFGFSIKASAQCTQKYFGASIVLGVFTSLMMYIPLIGPLVVPFICSIAATRYGHANRIEMFRGAVVG